MPYDFESRAGVVVEGDKPIMVESAKYCNNRNMGTSTIGNFAD
jgi:hypothetical protein